MMLPLVFLPLARSYFRNKHGSVISGRLDCPGAPSRQLSMATRFWRRFMSGLPVRGYVLSRYTFLGRNAYRYYCAATAIPTAVAGFALLLLWDRWNAGRLLRPREFSNVTAGQYTGHIS